MVCVDSRHEKSLTVLCTVLDTVVHDSDNKDDVVEFLKDDFTGHGKNPGTIWFKDACCGNTRCVRPGQILMRHSNGGYTVAS